MAMTGMTEGQPGARARWLERTDGALVVLVLAVALGIASFAARNSDIWLHLATGRWIASGKLPWGPEPFTHTAREGPWDNHAWLFDLGAYGVHQVGSGHGLVAAKALVVAATAALMIIAAPGSGWIGAGCALLGVLAMAPRLLLQPAVASYFLLAASLACLARGRWLVIPFLVALWANLDSWFLLGPFLVVVFLAGRLWSGEGTGKPWPWWLVPATLLASLAHPGHFRALRLPMELDPEVIAGPLGADPRLAPLFAPPGPPPWHNPSAWAFFGLLVLGGASFLARPKAARTWRGPLWVAFAALAVWQARLIPFFAVAGAPIAALNWSEALAGAGKSPWGRALAWGLAAVSLVLTVLGSTTGLYARDRGLAWGLIPDSGLARAAAGCAALPPGTRVFNTHPDLGHYLAWHAPEVRHAIDSRLQLFTLFAPEYQAACANLGLAGNQAPGIPLVGAPVVAAWDPDPGRLARIARALGPDKVTRVDGGVLLLVRDETAAGSPFSPRREAFQSPTRYPETGGGPAELAAADRTPWWPRGAGETGSWQASEAALFLRMAEGDAASRMAWLMLAIRAARSGIEADPADSTAWLTLGRAYLSLGTGGWERDIGSDSTPLEHVRFIQATAALSQASALNPSSMAARESLSRLFARRNILDLASRHGREVFRLMGRQGSPAGDSAPDRQARLNSAREWADLLEGSLFEAENQFLVRASGLSGDPLARARMAVGLGLVARAIDILATTHPDLYGAEGVGLLADLLLQTGQVAECLELLDRPEIKGQPDLMGIYNLPRKAQAAGVRIPHRLHARDWLDACAHAAAGRYPAGLEALGRLMNRIRVEEARMAPAIARGGGRFLAHDIALGASPWHPLLRLGGIGEQKGLADFIEVSRHLAGTRADLATLAGILDCERGERASALGRLAGAMAIQATLPQVRGETLAARYHRELASAP